MPKPVLVRALTGALLALSLLACGGQLDEDLYSDQGTGSGGSSASSGGSGGTAGSAGKAAGSAGSSQAGQGGSSSGSGGAVASGGQGGGLPGTAGAPPSAMGGAPGTAGAPTMGMAGSPSTGQAGSPTGTGGQPGAVSGPACQSCVEQVCTKQWSACEADAQCQTFADCMFAKCIGTMTKGCTQGCAQAAGIQVGMGSPPSESLQRFTQLMQCGSQSCPGDCPSTMGGGGPMPGG